ncbi:MAG: site-2 protease family protein, partial [Chloroflexota bacterium]
MGGSFQIANISGFKILINWTWILIIAFITFVVGQDFQHLYPNWSTSTYYIDGFISGLLLFVTVLLHELGHSFTARARNLPVNSITLYFFGGVSNLTEEPKSPQTELLVAIAGPIVSLILALIFYIIYLLTVPVWPSQVTAVIGYLALINVSLAVFNLIPAFPLDGGRVFRSIVWWVTGNKIRSTRVADGVTHVFGWLFIIAGLAEVFLTGSIISGVYLAFIGWFLMNAASQTYKQTLLHHTLRGVDVQDALSQP